MEIRLDKKMALQIAEELAVLDDNVQRGELRINELEGCGASHEHLRLAECRLNREVSVRNEFLRALYIVGVKGVFSIGCGNYAFDLKSAVGE